MLHIPLHSTADDYLPSPFPLELFLVPRLCSRYETHMEMDKILIYLTFHINKVTWVMKRGKIHI